MQGTEGQVSWVEELCVAYREPEKPETPEESREERENHTMELLYLELQGKLRIGTPSARYIAPTT